MKDDKTKRRKSKDHPPKVPKVRKTIKRTKKAKKAKRRTKSRSTARRYTNRPKTRSESKKKRVKSQGWKWGIGIEHEIAIVHDVHDVHLKGEDVKKYYKNVINQGYNKTHDKFVQKLSKTKQDEYPVNVLFNMAESLRELRNNKTMGIMRKNGRVTLDYHELSKNCKSWSTNPDRPGTLCMLEMVTRDYSNATPENAFEELIQIENTVINTLRNTKYAKSVKPYLGDIKYPSAGMYRFVTYESNGELKNVATNYLGSYHVNLTLPYKMSTPLEKFYEEHIEVARMLQWITPLLVAEFSASDEASFLDNDQFAEGSYRSALNPHSRPGAALLQFNLPTKRHLPYRAKWINMASRTMKGYPKTPKKCAPENSISNNRCGTDFRHDTEKMSDKHRFGFEFRIFDNIPAEYIPYMITMVLYVADHAHKYFISQGKKVPLATKSQHWSKAMSEAVTDGWSGMPSKEYMKILKDKLHFDNMSPKFGVPLGDLYAKLKKYLIKHYSKNGSGYYTDVIFKNKTKGPNKPYYDYYQTSPNTWSHHVAMSNTFMNPRMNKKLKTMMDDLKKKKTFRYDQFRDSALKHLGNVVKSDVGDLFEFLVNEAKIVRDIHGKPFRLNKKTMNNTFMIGPTPEWLNLSKKNKKYIPYKLPVKIPKKEPLFFTKVDNLINDITDILF